ncbi:MAG: dienelactone hydrolase family protein [Gammaproteobacteria bacterium]|nr:dienelactone hydrolase family protein [Gammaproteobacteria bacterium]
MITELYDYSDGDTALEGYIAFEEATEQKPLVLVAHDWTGRREFACKAAERIAAMGYIGFAMDMYGKGVFGAEGDNALNTSLMEPFITNRTMLRQRIGSAFKAARNMAQVDQTRVAAMGFCFGGLCVLELARSGADVQGVVSIHGILAADQMPNETITARILCLHGHDDPMVPPEQVLAFETEMTEAGADWQVHTYGSTKHAFTNPQANNPDFGTVHNPVAEARAYQSLSNFLAELFEA